MTAQQRLNEHLGQWDATLRNYRVVAQEEAEVKVLLKRRRSVVIVAARRNEKAAEWLADALADEDADAHELALRYARASAELAYIKGRLAWAQTTADGLRSEVSTERTESRLYAAERSPS